MSSAFRNSSAPPVDLEAFVNWLRAAREIREEHLFAYKQGAERILEVARGRVPTKRDVEDAVARERAAGSKPLALANLKRIGDELLQFIADPSIPKPRSRRTNVALLAAGCVALAVGIGLFARQRARKPVSQPLLGEAVVTYRDGRKCAVNGVKFHYSYLWQYKDVIGTPHEEHWTERVLHVKEPGFERSIPVSELREIRFYSDDVHVDRIAEIEILLRDGTHVSVLEAGNAVLRGDGTKFWTTGHNASWMRPNVMFEAAGACGAHINLTYAIPYAFPVRVEFR